MNEILEDHLHGAHRRDLAVLALENKIYSLYTKEKQKLLSGQRLKIDTLKAIITYLHVGLSFTVFSC